MLKPIGLGPTVLGLLGCVEPILRDLRMRRAGAVGGRYSRFPKNVPGNYKNRTSAFGLIVSAVPEINHIHPRERNITSGGGSVLSFNAGFFTTIWKRFYTGDIICSVITAMFTVTHG